MSSDSVNDNVLHQDYIFHDGGRYLSVLNCYMYVWMDCFVNTSSFCQIPFGIIEAKLPSRPINHFNTQYTVHGISMSSGVVDK